MPTTRNFQELHDRVTARPGAAERLAALRHDTLREIGLYELRRSLKVSQSELAVSLEVTQSAISQLERAEDLKVSTLSNYLECLGARLELVAVFNDDEDRVVPIRISRSTVVH